MAQGIGRFNLFGHDEESARRRRLAKLEFALFLRAQHKRVAYTLDTRLDRYRRRLAEAECEPDGFTTVVKTGTGQKEYAQGEQPFALSSEAARMRRYWE